MNVFIIGVSGGVGSRLAAQLIEQGHVVSGLYRRREQGDALGRLGVKGVLGDIALIPERDLAAALSGTDVVVFSAGAGSQDSDGMTDSVDGEGVRKAISAARIAEVSRLLLVSVFPEAWRERNMPRNFEHYMEVKKRADVELVRSGLDWVILRPSALTDHAGTGTVSLSPAEIHTEISRDDVAATIAEILRAPRIRRQILEVTAGDRSVRDAVKTLLAT